MGQFQPIFLAGFFRTTLTGIDNEQINEDCLARRNMKLDDDNWHCLTVSRRDPKTGKFTMEKMPVYHIIGDEEKKKAY